MVKPPIGDSTIKSSWPKEVFWNVNYREVRYLDKTVFAHSPFSKAQGPVITNIEHENIILQFIQYMRQLCRT